MAVAALDGLVLDHLRAVRTLLHGGSPRRRRLVEPAGYPTPGTRRRTGRGAVRRSVACRADGGAHRRPGVGQRHEPAGAPRRPVLRTAHLARARRSARASGRSSAPETRGVETLVIEPSSFDDRVTFDEAVVDALQRHGADVVVTAGYMRLLGRAGARRLRRAVAEHAPVAAAVVPGHARRAGRARARREGHRGDASSWWTRASTRARSCCRKRSRCATTTTGARSRRGSSRSSIVCCRAPCARWSRADSSSTVGV